VPVAIQQGRVHAYEGNAFDEIVFLLRVVRRLGAERLVVTNACGGITEDLRVGDLMLITDHIKLMADNPLRGENLPEFGVRFPDMTHTYTPEYRRVAETCAETLGIPLRKGVYMMFSGPSDETPAEIRAIRTLGGDLVGMSAVHEVIMARRSGIRTLGISLVSNMASGVLDQPLSEGEVLQEAGKASGKFERLLTAIIQELE
jgi:purine-nucleoside phosphorylase